MSSFTREPSVHSNSKRHPERGSSIDRSKISTIASPTLRGPESAATLACGSGDVASTPAGGGPEDTAETSSPFLPSAGMLMRAGGKVLMRAGDKVLMLIPYVCYKYTNPYKTHKSIKQRRSIQGSPCVGHASACSKPHNA